MKKLLVLVITAFSWPLMAADAQPATPELSRNYFQFFIGYSMNTKFQSGLQAIDYLQNSTDAFNLSVRYVHRIYKGFDWGLDANYESNRSFSSYTTQGITIPYLTPVPNLSIFYGRGLLAYNVGDFYVYGSGGMAMPLAINFLSNLSSDTVMGGGLGYRPSETFLIEVEYRMLSFKGVDRVTMLANDYFKQTGLLIKFGYGFR